MSKMFDLSRQRFIRQAVLGVGTLMLVAACGGDTADTADTADTGSEEAPAAETGGSILVATEPAFPPFEFQADDGSFTGFDIDLMNAIGEAAGVTVEYESLPFDGIIPALQAGTVDAAISAMTITAEREQVVDFSRPYFKAGLAIAVPEEDSETGSLEDLEGKRIAVQIGTTGAETANGIEGATVSTFDSAPLALQELANGNADAVINDAPVTLDAINSGNIAGLKVVGELVTEEFYGIATPDGSDTVALINEGLATVLEDGTYAEIYQEYFGEEPPELPEDYSPAE